MLDVKKFYKLSYAKDSLYIDTVLYFCDFDSLNSYVLINKISSYEVDTLELICKIF